MPGMPGQGMPHGMPGGPMRGPMPGAMGGPMGGAPPQGGYSPYGGGFPGAYGAPPPAANDPMWGYFTAIAGQVSVLALASPPPRRQPVFTVGSHTVSNGHFLLTQELSHRNCSNQTALFVHL